MDITQILNVILLISACSVAGAALYVSLVENPARNQGVPPQIRRKAFVPTYKKAAVSQATGLILSIAAAAALYFLTWSLVWVVGCALSLFVLGFTLLRVLPLNHIIVDPDADYSDERIAELLNRWTGFQIVRTVACVAAYILFVVATVY